MAKVEHYKNNKESVRDYLLVSKLHKLMINQLSKHQSKEIISAYIPDYTSALSIDEISNLYEMIKEKGVIYMLGNFKYHKNETLIKIIEQ